MCGWITAAWRGRPRRPTPPRASAAIELLRAYEEDLRPVFIPAPGLEVEVPGTLSIAQLNAPWRANPKALEKQFRNKVLTISGKVLRREVDESTLVMVSGNTDKPLRVRACSAKKRFRT